jgi:hypothetical protein
MPDELETRLERTLGTMPPPGAETSERALRSALAALPPPGEARRRRGRRLLVPAAACAVAFVFGGVTLAANGGRLPLVGAGHHHGPSTVRPPRPSRPEAVLPRGAIAFSAAAGGRVWLATSAGSSLHGRRLSTLAVSPGAVWALEGSGRELRAVGIPGGQRGFTRGIGGTPVAAAWAPAGIRIAYVARTPRGDRLYDMYGNGTHAFLVAPRVRAQAPSWRWDSQAFAYIRADGRVMVHDVIDGATRPLPSGCGIRRAAAVAFAPYGGLLAVADRSGRVRVVDTLRHTRGMCTAGAAGPGLPKLVWLDPRGLVVGMRDTVTRYVVGLAGGADVTDVPGQVAGIAASPGGRRIALALRDPSGHLRVFEARTPRFSEASHPLQLYRVLVDLDGAAGPVTLGWQ